MTSHPAARLARRNFPILLAFLLLVAIGVTPSLAQAPQLPPPGAPIQRSPAAPEHHSGGEANLKLPDLDQAKFLNGIGGRSLLMVGLLVGALGLLFGGRAFVYEFLSKFSRILG